VECVPCQKELPSLLTTMQLAPFPATALMSGNPLPVLKFST